jgi:type IV pilus assembly protein PilQ
VGDIAVGTMMLANPSYLNVSGPAVTMTLRNAPAKDVLMALSQMGGYGFAYVEDCKGQGEGQSKGFDCDTEKQTTSSANRKVTISFRSETTAARSIQPSWPQAFRGKEKAT